MSVVVKGARSQSHSPTFSNSPSEPLAPHIETIKLILSSLGRSVQRTSQGPMKLGHYRFMASGERVRDGSESGSSFFLLFLDTTLPWRNERATPLCDSLGVRIQATCRWLRGSIRLD